MIIRNQVTRTLKRLGYLIAEIINKLMLKSC